MNTKNLFLDEKLVKVVPYDRQIAYQSLEFYSFVHFGMNTMTGKEWGDGTESPQDFNPQNLDAIQWVKLIGSKLR